MSLAPIIRELIAAGVTGEALVAAVERIEATLAVPSNQTARQERNRRYYERKASEKRLKASELDASETVLKPSERVLIKTPLARVEDNNPNIRISGKKESTEVAIAPRAPASRPGKRCPPDWNPRPETTVKLITEGHKPDLMSREIEKFRDYTFASAKSDWDATWRNWVRNAAPSRGGKSPNWRELEAENNDASYRGAAMAIEIMKEKDRLNDRPGQDGIIDGSCSALPQIEQNGSGAGALVVRLSDRLAGTLSRGG